MKSTILCLLATVSFTTITVAQQRMHLVEEFSGENCGPCAKHNPRIATLMSAPNNVNKVTWINYQVPIPGDGPIYNQYQTVADARMSYYNVSSAPTGLQNGNEWNNSMQIYVQSAIDLASAATAFSMSATHTWSANGDSVYATITINALAAYAPANAQMKLRVALVENLDFCSSAGSNGERNFHNVVRDMYPNVGGTPIANAWTTGQSQTITIGGKVKDWIDKTNDHAVIVAWLQNDATKNIPQSTRSVYTPFSKDAALTGCAQPNIYCTGTTTNVNPRVTLKNTGNTPLTAVQIYHKLDNTAYQAYNWSGSLAPGASVSVAMPAYANVPVGVHSYTDSIVGVNGGPELNKANNVMKTPLIVYNNTPVAFPISENFERAGATPPNWVLVDENMDGQNWQIVKHTARNSTYCLSFAGWRYAPGERNMAILPMTTMPAGQRLLEFYVAHTKYLAAYIDTLDVVYSTDCGTTWNSLWKQNSNQLTTSPDYFGTFIPTASEWRLVSLNITAVPTNAMYAFRASSGNNNYIYIEDVNIRSGSTSVNNVLAETSLRIYPNPASSSADISFTLWKDSKIKIAVLDAMGRMMQVQQEAMMKAGQQTVTLNTGSLSTGIYEVKIMTENGTVSRKLSILK